VTFIYSNIINGIFDSIAMTLTSLEESTSSPPTGTDLQNSLIFYLTLVSSATKQPSEAKIKLIKFKLLF
jgi:hypothetical protein